MTADLPDARVLLVGMMGSGKTTVGREISRRTGWEFRDNDDALKALTGMTTPELHTSRGTEALRAAESEAMHHALAAPPPFVAGIAAGVVESDDDVAALREADALVVYLFAPLDVLVERVGDGTGRPWLEGDPVGALRKLYDGREERYRAVADLVVDSATGTPEQQADQVIQALQTLRG